MDFKQQHPITHIHHAGAVVACQFAACGLQPGHRDPARVGFEGDIAFGLRAVVANLLPTIVILIKRLITAGDHLLDPIGHRVARFFKRRDMFLYANRIPDFKRPQFMTEAPLLSVVHIHNRLGDLRHTVRSIGQIEGMMMPQVLSGAVIFLHHPFDALTCVLDLTMLAHAVEAYFGWRLVFQRLQVERPQFARAVCPALHLVEAAVRLATEPVTLKQFFAQAGSGGVIQHLARRVVGDRFVQIAGDMRRHIEADQIVQVEGRGLRAANQRPGDGIHFLDREIMVKRVVHGLHPRHGHEAVADEVRLVPGDHHAFTELARGELDHKRHQRGVGLFVRDYFQQVQVARRVEEVCPQKTPLKALVQPFGNRFNRQAGGVGGDNGALAHDFGQLRHQVLLDVQPLDDDLNHPIRIRHHVQIVVNVPGLDQRQIALAEQLRRARLLHRRQPAEYDSVTLRRRVAGLRVLRRNIEQHGLNPNACQQRRDSPAHRARADHSGLVNPIRHKINLSKQHSLQI